MKFAADFRAIARNELRGHWLIAALTGFVASLIGAQIAGGGSSVGSNNDSENRFPLKDYLSDDILILIQLVLTAVLLLAIVHWIVMFFFGGAGKLGYARFNLNLIDGGKAEFRDLFSQFHRLGSGFCMNLLLGIYTFLWTLLFIIPGIVKSHSYAMTPYILYEHPEYSANQAITESRRMMDGNKFRLFCLNLSFIGWSILCAMPTIVALMSLMTGTWGILLLPLILLSMLASLFLCAYHEAAHAAFYREISGTALPEEVLTTV